MATASSQCEQEGPLGLTELMLRLDELRLKRLGHTSAVSISPVSPGKIQGHTMVTYTNFILRAFSVVALAYLEVQVI